MYAYIDETGNTGRNLFDPEQPVFMYGALMSRMDFDTRCRQSLNRLAEDIGAQAVHASDLGINKLELIAGELLALLANADAHIFVGRVVKVDLAVMKLVDILFDSGENMAVPWHVYNTRPLRLLNVIKIAHLLDENILSGFWNALMETNQQRAYEQLEPILKEIRSRVNSLPDQRSREIISQAIQWAIENPESIHYYSNSKALRNGHLPNMTIFPELLGSIEIKSQDWQQPVVEIKHDRQSQFEKMVTEWHALFSTATADPLILPFGEKHIFRRVFGSKFTISSSVESPGIQMIDTILWLFRQLERQQPLPVKCAKLVEYSITRGDKFELSLPEVISYLSDFFQKLQSVPITASQQENAEHFLKIAEDRRQQNIREYAMKKLSGNTTDSSLLEPKS